LETYLEENIRLDMNIDTIIKKCCENDKKKYVLCIKSYAYDLNNEKGIICYYNTNEMYNNELLDKIFE